MYLYGGCASGFGPCPLGDLWRFDFRSGQWTEIRAAVAPQPRQYYGFAFDDARRRLILHGGSGATIFNDTWEFEPVSQTWTQLNIANPPPARQRLQGLYAPAPADTVFFFGGTKGGSKTADLLSLAPAPPAIVNAFSQAAGAFAPGTMVSIYGAGLPANPALTAAGRAATVLFASPTQINARLSPETPLGRTSLLRVPLTIVERAPASSPLATASMTSSYFSPPAPMKVFPRQ